MPAKARDWILTFNNPPDNYLDGRFDEERMRSLIGQLERGEQGTLHWQLGVSYRGQVRLATVVRDFGQGVHAEVRRGSRAELMAYVTKDDTREPGSMPVQFGERLDGGLDGGGQGM